MNYTKIIDDGGPAFPQPAIDNGGRIDYADQMGYGGMSLRDWFAGQSLASLIAARSQRTKSDACDSFVDDMIECGVNSEVHHYKVDNKPATYGQLIALDVYDIADAMIAASKAVKS